VAPARGERNATRPRITRFGGLRLVVGRARGYEYCGVSVLALIVIAVLLQRVSGDVLTPQMPMVRLSAGNECTAYDYWVQVGQFSIGLLGAVGGTLVTDRTNGNIAIASGCGYMVLACFAFAHCGIH
jgi:hypothetical protein